MNRTAFGFLKKLTYKSIFGLITLVLDFEPLQGILRGSICAQGSTKKSDKLILIPLPNSAKVCNVLCDENCRLAQFSFHPKISFSTLCKQTPLQEFSPKAAFCGILVSLIMVGASLPLSALELTPVVPESVGMSADRLALLDEKFQQLVDQEKLPGCVTLVLREGKVVYFSALGDRDKESQAPHAKGFTLSYCFSNQSDCERRCDDAARGWPCSISMNQLASICRSSCKPMWPQATEDGYEIVPLQNVRSLSVICSLILQESDMDTGIGEDPLAKSRDSGMVFCEPGMNPFAM